LAGERVEPPADRRGARYQPHHALQKDEEAEPGRVGTQARPRAGEVTLLAEGGLLAPRAGASARGLLGRGLLTTPRLRPQVSFLGDLGSEPVGRSGDRPTTGGASARGASGPPSAVVGLSPSPFRGKLSFSTGTGEHGHHPCKTIRLPSSKPSFKPPVPP